MDLPKRALAVFVAALALSVGLAAASERPADPRPFPEPGSKKGLQVQMVDDAIALGVRHAALNVSLGGLVDPEKKPGNPTWTVDGETFAFRKSYLDRLGVKPLSDAGANVYLILLAYQTGQPELDQRLLHPSRDAKLPNKLAAVNTVTPEGARLWRALVEFLADWFCRPGDEHGRVVGFIIGNEVNVHHEWHNFGPMSAEAAIADYQRQVCMAHAAVRKASASARVYVSMTHHWTLAPSADPKHGMPGRTFLDLFAREARAGGDYDWHIAHHPYPENLGNPRTWDDRSALPNADAPRITFKNLEQLQAYLDRPEMQFAGKRRSIILSEQGFHSDGSVDGKRGENVQAAAYCYAWEKVARLDGVHAFILHRHVDHKREGGLNLGLWRRQPESVATPSTKKRIYDCFAAAGTPRQAEVFSFALPIVGIKDWSEVSGR